MSLLERNGRDQEISRFSRLDRDKRSRTAEASMGLQEIRVKERRFLISESDAKSVPRSVQISSRSLKEAERRRLSTRCSNGTFERWSRLRRSSERSFAMAPTPMAEIMLVGYGQCTARYRRS